MNFKKLKHSISPLSGILFLTLLIGLFFMIASFNRGVENEVERTTAHMSIVKANIENEIENMQQFLNVLKTDSILKGVIQQYQAGDSIDANVIFVTENHLKDFYKFGPEIEGVFVHHSNDLFAVPISLNRMVHQPTLIEESDWNENTFGYYKTTLIQEFNEIKLLIDVPISENNQFTGYMLSVITKPIYLYDRYLENTGYGISLISSGGVFINNTLEQSFVDQLIKSYGLHVIGSAETFNSSKANYYVADFNYFNHHIVTSEDITSGIGVLVYKPYDKFNLSGIQDYLLSHLIIFGLLVLAVLSTIIYSSQKTKQWLENDKQFSNEIIEMDKIQISELKKEIRFHNDFFNESAVPMLVIDKESLRITNVNNGAIEFYGYKEEDFLDLYLSDVCEWVNDEKQATDIFSINHIKRDGSVVESRIRVQEVNYAENELIVMMIIGGHMQNTEFLKDMKLEMFHEIRSPLQGAYGAVEMLEKATDAYSDYTSIIKRSLTNVLMMTNNVLADGKLNSSQDQIFISEFDLVSLVNEVVETTVYQDKNYNLIAGHVQVNENDLLNHLDNYHIKSDPIKLRQILINLMSNGSKYTEDGLVNLIVEVKSGEVEDIVIFRISDTGMGLTKDQLDHMYETFKTYNSKSNISSTGIGLSITKKYVEILGSELHVNSEYGLGTNFSFSLTVAPSKVKTHETLPQKSILVIDDDEVSCAFLKHLLTYELNYFVKTITNETLILSELTHHEYDCLIVDQNLNHFKGVDLITLIRNSMNHRVAELPILLMTASKTKHEFRKISGAKVDEILLKPFKSDEIIETLNNLFNKEKVEVLPLYQYINGEIINAELLRETIEAVGKVVFVELVSKFKANSTEELNLITNLFAEQNYDAIKPLLHRLKGSMSYFAPKTCKTQIQSLEIMALNRDLKFSETFQQFLKNHELLLKELQMICRNL